MVKANAQLVTFNHGPVATEMTARAEADAVASFDMRRGLRLSAEARAEVEGHLTATIGNSPEHASTVATVEASLGVSARLALAAQLDVNGLWAEACGAAEARARVRGDIAVTGRILLDAIGADPKLPRGAMVPAEAFLREVEIHAGVYAEAYFALRARARLMVSGSVIPKGQDETASAFTVAFNYGYAYIFGAGVSGYLDVDLPDVPRVMAIVIDAVLDEVLRLLPADTPPQIETLLQLVTPLAGSAAVAIGQALGAPQSAEPDAGDDVGDVVQAFLLELRTKGLDFALDAVLTAGVEQAKTLIDRALDDATMTAGFREKASTAVTEVMDVFWVY
jgi:hypothetical protein